MFCQPEEIGKAVPIAFCDGLQIILVQSVICLCA